jgi:hypothetical protein
MKVERPSRYCGMGSRKFKSQKPRLTRGARRRIIVAAVAVMLEICRALGCSLSFWIVGEGMKECRF